MKLQSIQILRGLAALLIVFYHTRAQEFRSIAANGASEPSWLTGIVTNGFAGVDLFFVISGFIMVFVTKNQPRGMRTAADFLFARLTRVYPIWWFFAGITTIYMVGLQGLGGYGEGWPAFGHAAPVVPYILKSFALLPQADDPVLAVGWTLVHEVYFYLIFSLFLLASKKWWPALLLAWGIAVVAGSMFGLSGPRPIDLSALVFFPMTLEFILGAATGLIVTSGLAWRPGSIMLLSALGLCAALCIQGVETEHTLQWGRVLLYGIPSTVLIYGIVTLEMADRLAWLVPAAIGCAVCIIVFQLYGTVDTSPIALRRGGTILAVSVGALAMLATLWAGWLGGQVRPQAIRALGPPLGAVKAWFVRIGDASYSLYLVHTIVIVALRLVFHALGKVEPLAPVFRVGHPGLLDNVVYTLVCLGASIWLSLLSYNYVERPMVRMFRAWRGKMFDASRRTPAPN